MQVVSSLPVFFKLSFRESVQGKNARYGKRETTQPEDDNSNGDGASEHNEDGEKHGHHHHKHEVSKLLTNLYYKVTMIIKNKENSDSFKFLMP